MSFPKSTYVPLAFSGKPSPVNGLLVSGCRPQASASSAVIHTCIGKTVELYFENIFYSVQLRGRKQGAYTSVMEVFKQNITSPVSQTASLMVCVLCWKQGCTCLDPSSKLIPSISLLTHFPL